MKLTLKSTGSTAAYVSWLKSFKDIRSSLLIEIDPQTQEFIAKSFPDNKCIVKYSALSFENAGLEMSAIVDNNGEQFDWANCNSETDKRIKVGLFEILNKVISVEDMFDGTEHSMNFHFDLANNITYIGSKDVNTEYVCTNIVLSSMSLTMDIKAAGTQIGECFQKCDDETFLKRACNIGSPSVYSVSADTLLNLNKISSVFAVDDDDLIKFYSKEIDGHLALYAFDERNSHYDYLLGYYESGEQGKTSTIVKKSNFINATKGLTEDKFMFTLDTAGASRVLVDAGNSKIVIAAEKK